jgi:type 1 glutamine amidotransferase
VEKIMRKAIFVLLLAAVAAAAATPAKIVLVAGKPSHGPGAHEHNAGVTLLEKFLNQNKGVKAVAVRNGWPEDASVFDGARSIVLYMDGGGGHPLLVGDRMATIAKLAEKGVGLSFLHYTVEVPKENSGPQFLKWIGGYYERPYSVNPMSEADLVQASPQHPISRGWKSFHLKDEWYYRIRFDPADRRVTPILTTMLPKDAPNKETVAWVVERADGGRGFGFTGGHFHTNWGVLEFRRLLVNAILWTAKVDVPKNGARCDLRPGDLERNLDPKRK